jgi:hypothetical protein
MINFSQWLMNIIQTIAIIIASGAAIYGINSWRREAKGRTILDLSEKTLALFYEAKDNITSIRNPANLSGKGSTRPKSDDETEEETKRFNQGYIVTERYNVLRHRFYELFSLKYTYMAVFGKENGKHFDELRKIINEIRIANYMLVTYYRNPQYNKPENFKSQQEFEKFHKGLQEHERVIWEHGDDDEINLRIDNIITEVEKVCELASKKAK